MEKLNDIHQSDLTAEAFDRFPIWTWDDEQEGYNPLAGSGPLPVEFPTIFIRATFTTPSGHKLNGYLTGLESFYAFGLFVGGTEYTVNLNLPDLAAPVLRSIMQKIGCGNIVPLRFSADVAIEGRPPITGTFDKV